MTERSEHLAWFLAGQAYFDRRSQSTEELPDVHDRATEYAKSRGLGTVWKETIIKAFVAGFDAAETEACWEDVEDTFADRN